MPSGPKKRRAAAKKKEQQPEKSKAEAQDEISPHQEALSAEVVQQFIHNPVDNEIEDVGNDVAEKAGSEKGLSSVPVVTSVEPVQIARDKSVHESNQAVGSECLASDLLSGNEPVKNILDEIDHESNRSVEKAVSELLASNLLTGNEQVKNILDEIDHETNQSIEKGVSELLDLDLLTSNEHVKNTVDKSVHETNQAVENVESESLASGFLTSNEEVKITVDESVQETNQAVEKAESGSLASDFSTELVKIIADVVDHESNQDAEKAESEMVASGLLMNNEEVKHNTDDVDHESKQTVCKAGSEMVASVFVSTRNYPVMNNTTGEVIESIQGADKAGSKTVASELLMNNEEVKHTADDVDNELNQTVSKRGSEMMASVFSTTSNDPVLKTTDEVIESIQAADKAGSEITVVQDHHASVFKEEISVGEENVVIAKRTDDTDDVSGIMQEISVASEGRDETNLYSLSFDKTLIEETKVSHLDSGAATEIIQAIAENKMDGPAMMPKDVENPCDSNDPDTDYESLNKLKSDFQPLQKGGVCSCILCSLVCNLSEIKDIKCCHLGDTIGTSSQVKRVKEVLEKELMASEKLRLVLKKALDDLYEAAA